MKVAIGVKDFGEVVKRMEASPDKSEQFYAKLLVEVIGPLDEILKQEIGKGEDALPPVAIANVMGTIAGTILSMAAVNFSPVPQVAYAFMMDKLISHMGDLPEVSARDLHAQGLLNE